MGERKHKAESHEKKDKVSQNNKTNSQIDHPILQLQQTIGNKAVSNMVQCHPEQAREILELQNAHTITRTSNIYSHQRIDEHEANHP